MTVLNEAERQFFLGVAGVRLWYARAPLPGAAPSPEFAFALPEPQPQPLPESAPVPPAPGVRTAGSPSPVAASHRRPAAAPANIARIQGLLAETAAVTPAPQAPAALTPAIVSAETVAETRVSPEVPGPRPELVADGAALEGRQVQAHWGFWSGPEWVLMSSLSADASRALQDALAGNILRALRADVQSQRELRWPVFNNSAVAGNDAAGLVDVVTTLATEFAGRRLLMLGVSPEGSRDPLLAEVLAPLGQPSLAFPASLAALAADPARKRELWQDLKPLLESQGRV